MCPLFPPDAPEASNSRSPSRSACSAALTGRRGTGVRVELSCVEEKRVLASRHKLEGHREPPPQVGLDRGQLLPFSGERERERSDRPVPPTAAAG
jgi:hypothetical protein